MESKDAVSEVSSKMWKEDKENWAGAGDPGGAKEEGQEGEETSPIKVYIKEGLSKVNTQTMSRMERRSRNTEPAMRSVKTSAKQLQRAEQPFADKTNTASVRKSAASKSQKNLAGKDDALKTIDDTNRSNKKLLPSILSKGPLGATLSKEKPTRASAIK